MELKSLYPFILLLVMTGMLLGIGILVLDKFSTTAADPIVVTNESFVVPAVGVGVSLANEDYTVFTKVWNGSNEPMNVSTYSVSDTYGVLTTVVNDTYSGCEVGSTCFAYYTYRDYTGATATSLRDTRDAIAEISTSWLPLIVIVAVLAIILTLVIGSFMGYGRKR